MTLQINDAVNFAGNTWALCRQPESFSVPTTEELGSSFHSESSACARGRVDNFEIDESGRLFLCETDICIPKLEWQGRIRSPSNDERFREELVRDADGIGSRVRHLFFSPPIRAQVSGEMILCREYVGQASSPLQAGRNTDDANAYRERAILHFDVKKNEATLISRESGTHDHPFGKDPIEWRRDVVSARRRAREDATAAAARTKARKEEKAHRRDAHTKEVFEKSMLLLSEREPMSDGEKTFGECPLCSNATDLRFFGDNLLLCYRCYFKW